LVNLAQDRTVLPSASSVNSVAISHDGKRIASAVQGGAIQIWDLATGQPALTIPGNSRPVYSIAFSPDGSLLASASADNTVKLWETATGEVKFSLDGHTAGVRSVSFSSKCSPRVAMMAW
jgi:WD40 repeat protein